MIEAATHGTPDAASRHLANLRKKSCRFPRWSF